MTLEKQADLLKSVHIIAVLNRCMEVEHANTLIDQQFKCIGIKQHNKRIIESCTAIRKSLNSPNMPFVLKDAEDMDYNYSLQMYRVIDHFVDMGFDVIKDFMDQVDIIKKENGSK